MMNSKIKHIVSKAETLESIAQDYGITVFELKNYHNQSISDIKQHIGFYVDEGMELFMKNEKPPKPPLQVKESDEKEEQRKDEREDKKQAQNSGKEEFFVVDGAKCICDKGKTPATLKVTSHKKHIFNSKDEDKWAATLEDTQFKEGNTCFGSCALKNNYPCSFAPVGLWLKPFEKVKVMDKKVLVESSYLMCAVGGKITIQHHGQTIKVGKASVQKADSELLNQVLPGVNFEEFKAEFDDNQYYI